MSKEIQLTQGKVAIVDDADYEELSKYKWHYAAGYAARTPVQGEKKLRMHRKIMNAPDGVLVDHRNGDTVDNRRENLRIATSSQNCMNRAISRNNTSGHRGVYLTPNGKYRALLKIDGIRIHLGMFKDFQAAINARNEAVIKFHGEFGRLTPNV